MIIKGKFPWKLVVGGEQGGSNGRFFEYYECFTKQDHIGMDP